MTLTVTFDLLLKNFVISHNFLILRDKAFILGKCVPFDKAFLMITNFERVTLTVTFDLLLNIGHDCLTVRDWVFIFSICVPHVHTFPIIGMFAVTSRLWLVGREATTVTRSWPGKSVVFTRVSPLPELVFSLLNRIYKIYSDILKEDKFLYKTIQPEWKYFDK